MVHGSEALIKEPPFKVVFPHHIFWKGFYINHTMEIFKAFKKRKRVFIVVGQGR